MTRYKVLLAAVVGALTLVGCSQKAPAVNVSTGEERSGVAVTGVGEVTGTPDTLTLTMGVSLVRDTVNAAVTDAGAATTGVVEALEAAGVSSEDLQTANYSVNPEYEYRNDSQDLTGYRVSNTLTVTIRDLDRAGDVIDSAIEAGGDDATVNGVAFKLDDDEDAVTEARTAAFEDAKAKAEQFAKLSGLTLGDVVSVTETARNSSEPPPFAADAMRSSDEGTPIEAGEVTTGVTIDVRWTLE